MHSDLRAAMCLGLLAAAVPSGVGAQVPLSRGPLDSGALVRMTPNTGPPVNGRLVQRFTPSDSVLRYCRYPGSRCTDAESVGNIRVVPTRTLRGLDVSEGTHRTKGLVIGGLIGSVLFGGIAAAAHGLCETTDCPAPFDVGVLGGLSGMLLGALFGDASPRWRSP